MLSDDTIKGDGNLNMKKQIMLVGLLICIGIVSIASVMAVLSNVDVWRFGGAHDGVVGRISIIDTNLDLSLTAKCVDAGERTFEAGYYTLGVFQPGKTYLHSTWIWQRYGDTEFGMSVWGPDEDGKYEVELGRTSGYPFKITVDGATVLTIPAIKDWTNWQLGFDGYYILYI